MAHLDLDDLAESLDNGATAFCVEWTVSVAPPSTDAPTEPLAKAASMTVWPLSAGIRAMPGPCFCSRRFVWGADSARRVRAVVHGALSRAERRDTNESSQTNTTENTKATHSA